jgi:hypothetical protein
MADQQKLELLKKVVEQRSEGGALLDDMGGALLGGKGGALIGGKKYEKKYASEADRKKAQEDKFAETRAKHSSKFVKKGETLSEAEKKLRADARDLRKQQRENWIQSVESQSGVPMTRCEKVIADKILRDYQRKEKNRKAYIARKESKPQPVSEEESGSGLVGGRRLHPSLLSLLRK